MGSSRGEEKGGTVLLSVWEREGREMGRFAKDPAMKERKAYKFQNKIDAPPMV